MCERDGEGEREKVSLFKCVCARTRTQTDIDIYLSKLTMTRPLCESFGQLYFFVSLSYSSFQNCPIVKKKKNLLKPYR